MPTLHDDDLRADLLALIQTWEARVREAQARIPLERQRSSQAAYQLDAAAKAFQRAADELRQLLEAHQSSEAENESGEPFAYVPVDRAQVQALLNRAGLHARSLSVHADNAFTVTFSRMQPVAPEQRVSQLTAAAALSEHGLRLLVLDYGKLPDSGEPFIDFAFAEADSL